MHSIKNRLFLGTLFLLPFFAIFLLLEKLWSKFSAASQKIDEFIGAKTLLGPYADTIIILVLLAVFVYLSGYLADNRISSRLHRFVEYNFLELIPGYLVHKNKINEKMGIDSHSRKPVYLVNGDEKKPAILIEQTANECLLFVPAIPDTNSGELVVVPATAVELIAMPYKDYLRYLNNLGKGLLEGGKGGGA